MKKLLLASAIAALSVSTANAAPTVYGKAFLTVDYEDKETTLAPGDTEKVKLNSNSSRVGFKGSEAITANTDVIYQLEYGIDVDEDKGNNFKSRDTYLGFKNNTAGEFRFGRNQSSTDYVNNVTIAGTGGYWDNLGTTHNMVDSGRIDNSLLWKAPQIANLPVEVVAMVASGESNSAEGYGVAVMFDQGTGITAGVAYDKDLNLTEGYGDEGDIIRATVSADLAKLGAGLPLTLGALYQEADFDGGTSKEKGYLISAEMGIQNLAKPASVYLQYNNTSDLRGVNGEDSDQIVLGGKYFYKPNVIAHAYAGKNDSDRNDTETLAIGGGLEYKF